jgi:hypothetical protein
MNGMLVRTTIALISGTLFLSGCAMMFKEDETRRLGPL